MSSKKLQKTKIIYERLKEEYDGGFENWDDFAEKFGVSRQAINSRKNKKTLDYDLIKRVFPDVNKRWLYSENEFELKALPVMDSFTNDESTNDRTDSQDEANDPEVQYAGEVDLPKEGKLSRGQMKQFLQQIESIARILKDSL